MDSGNTIRAAEEADWQSEASAAVAPNIFDAHVHPNLLLPLVLANLLSPQLWSLTARVLARSVEGDRPVNLPDPGAAGDPWGIPSAVREVQRQIDRHFEHLSPARVAEIYGEYDLDEERRRLGSAAVDYAIDRIGRTLRWRRERGTLPDASVLSLEDCVARGRFPAFHYANFDVVRASRRHLRRQAHSTIGLTSCLDETAIFAALAMTLPAGMVDTIVVLASPAHYTAFGWDATGRAWWFFGKNVLYSSGDWRDLVAEHYGGDAQQAFEDRLPDWDRIIGVTGSFQFSDGRCSIPDERVERITIMIDGFFGVRLCQLDAALGRPRRHEGIFRFAPVFRELLGVASIDTVRQRLLCSDGNQLDAALEAVRFAYRSLRVKDARPYLEVARRSPSCRRIGAGLASLEEAVAVVAGIAGTQSIFEDEDRIAMPEETLRFQTGNDRDRALLLHVLLEQMYAARDEFVPVETLFTESDSLVRAADFCFSTRTMSAAGLPTSEILVRLAD